jgi:hypothetical protein
MVRARSTTNAIEMQSAVMTAQERQQLIDEIEQLRHELAQRQSFRRPIPGSVVHAYHEVLGRHYDRLDRLSAE